LGFGQQAYFQLFPFYAFSLETNGVQLKKFGGGFLFFFGWERFQF